MMLAKRGCPPVRRTTSMTRIMTVDGLDPSDHEFKEVEGSQYSMAAIVSPRYHRKISGEGFPANFLTTCGLCNRRLTSGRDIYMYRGETAFCSLECREQQMKQDEKNEKAKLSLSDNIENHCNNSELPSANSEASSKTETIAAA